MTEEFKLRSKRCYNAESQTWWYYEKDVKEFIRQIELDLLKKYKRASIPIMEIIKKRAGKLSK